MGALQKSPLPPFTKGGLGGISEVGFQNGSSLQNLESLNVSSTQHTEEVKINLKSNSRTHPPGWIGASNMEFCKDAFLIEKCLNSMISVTPVAER